MLFRSFVPFPSHDRRSAGIGAGYLNRKDSELNKFKGKDTNETYRLRNGTKLNLPIYYRNKIYTDEEREKLFIQKIEKGDVWICGEKVKIDDQEAYKEVLKYRDWESTLFQRNRKRIYRTNRRKQTQIYKRKNH